MRFDYIGAACRERQKNGKQGNERAAQQAHCRLVVYRVYPQYVQQNGRSVPVAVQAMKDARKAVDELDEANELEPLEMALESSRMFAK